MTANWHIAHSEASMGWGGQEIRVMAELLGFRARGCTVHLIAPRESRIYSQARKEGIPVYDLDTRKSRYPLTAWRLSRWLRKNTIEVLNTHSSRDGYVAGFAGRLAKTPLIIRSRHIDVDYPNPRISRHAFATLADHVVTTSEQISGHLRKTLNLPQARVSTIPTGIDVELFSPGASPAADVGSAGQNDPPLVGMISVLRSWKGHLVLLESFEQLRNEGIDLSLIITGEGPMRAPIESKVRESSYSSAISLLGHREDVPAILRSLDLLLIPSMRHEGVPQVGLQALACKTPVIGTAVGGIPEIIRDGETGRIVPPENVEALAAAVRAALVEKEKTAAMAERGRAEVLRTHSLDHMLDKLDSLYRDKLRAAG